MRQYCTSKHTTHTQTKDAAILTIATISSLAYLCGETPAARPRLRCWQGYCRDAASAVIDSLLRVAVPQRRPGAGYHRQSLLHCDGLLYRNVRTLIFAAGRSDARRHWKSNPPHCSLPSPLNLALRESFLDSFPEPTERSTCTFSFLLHLRFGVQQCAIGIAVPGRIPGRDVGGVLCSVPLVVSGSAAAGGSPLQTMKDLLRFTRRPPQPCNAGNSHGLPATCDKRAPAGGQMLRSAAPLARVFGW